ncbi:hypothetical protein DFJ74DRAFT_631302 [Hyaloraphidium curvatum]|nr:hypothetical protein DFJ74DRAFT_631302 [Hyaloraphidium curvatum]
MGRRATRTREAGKWETRMTPKKEQKGPPIQPDISNGTERVPVPGELPQPLDFAYIARSVLDRRDEPGRAARPPIPFYPGCSCGPGPCDPEDCSCAAEHGFLYSSDGVLLLLGDRGQQRPLYECNSACGCSADCRNRLVQHGVSRRLAVRPADGKGLGVFAVDQVPRGGFVCEYAGELVALSEARSRLAEHPENHILVIREHAANPDGNGSRSFATCVDPTKQANVGRILNHSCDPNLAVVLVRIDGLAPTVAFFASRDIAEGEELCWDYGAAAAGGSLPGARPCLCGTAKCRGRLPSLNPFTD